MSMKFSLMPYQYNFIHSANLYVTQTNLSPKLIPSS